MKSKLSRYIALTLAISAAVGRLAFVPDMKPLFSEIAVIPLSDWFQFNALIFIGMLSIFLAGLAFLSYAQSYFFDYYFRK